MVRLMSKTKKKRLPSTLGSYGVNQNISYPAMTDCSSCASTDLRDLSNSALCFLPLTSFSVYKCLWSINSTASGGLSLYCVADLRRTGVVQVEVRASSQSVADLIYIPNQSLTSIAGSAERHRSSCCSIADDVVS